MTQITPDLLYTFNGYAPDKITLYRLVAQLIAWLPRGEHLPELGQLVRELRMAGVHGDAVEALECALEEMA